MTDNGIHCAHCGRFVSGYEAAGSRCDYTPDGHFTKERIEWVCAKCIEKEKLER